jgi:hypothetical protein
MINVQPAQCNVYEEEPLPMYDSQGYLVMPSYDHPENIQRIMEKISPQQQKGYYNDRQQLQDFQTNPFHSVGPQSSV